MKPPEQVKTEFFKQWLGKAVQDLAAAKILLREETSFLSTVGFHCQQAAEKYLKAFLTWHQIEFPKTHDIDEILDLVAKVDSKLAKSLRNANILTDYAVEIRYPGDAPELTLEQAREAVKVAEKTRKAILRAIKKK